MFLFAITKEHNLLNLILCCILRHKKKITNGDTVELEVCYPWLPPKCEVCRQWGHKGPECSAKNITILQKDTSSALTIVEGGGNQASQQNPVADLLQELEEFTPYAPLGNGVEVNKMLNSIVLGTGMVEVSQSEKALVPSTVGLSISPSGRWGE